LDPFAVRRDLETQVVTWMHYLLNPENRPLPLSSAASTIATIAIAIATATTPTSQRIPKQSSDTANYQWLKRWPNTRPQ